MRNKRTPIIVSIIFMAIMVLASCGVGNYSISSGKADQAAIFVTDDSSYDVAITIDGTLYQTKTVKNKAIKKRRNIKQLTKYKIVTTPGRHTVSVTANGQEVYNKTVELSTSETRMIEL